MLASDLDGTLIPPVRDDVRLEEVRRFSEAVAKSPLTLGYVTGRDRELAMRGIEAVALPLPDLLVCDVGTSIWVRRNGRSGYVLEGDYRERMRSALGGADREALRAEIEPMEGLELQESSKQGEFKVSYYVRPDRRLAIREEVTGRLADLPVPPKIVWSHDPYSERLLLDLLPRGVAKHTALEYLRERGGYAYPEIVYAGDSGNDFDAFLSGHPAIVVANAPEDLKREIREGAHAGDVLERLYFSRSPYAGGVLEGLGHFGAL